MAPTPCPACGAPLILRDELAGRMARCPRCGHFFTAPQAAPPQGPAAEDVVSTEAPPPEPALPPMIDGSRQRERQRRKRLSVLLALGMVAGVILLGCGGLGTMIYIAYIHGTEEPISAADRDMVITAERLSLYLPGVSLDFRRGTLKKVSHLDGSRELTYEYTTPDGAREALYINSAVSVEPTPRDASVSYASESIGTQVGFRLQLGNDLKEVERNDLWKWGDESRCVVLTSNGKKVGNIFRARKGRRYFSIFIAGLYFNDAAAIRDLLAPIVERIDGYNG
jgi:hypothetical protein